MNCLLSLFLIIYQNPKPEAALESAAPNSIPFPEPKTISTENGSALETQDKDVVMEGLGSIRNYDHWTAPSVTRQHPKPRYEVLFLFLTCLLFTESDSSFFKLFNCI